MRKLVLVLALALFVGLIKPVVGGGVFLLDREPATAVCGPIADNPSFGGEAQERSFYLISEGRVWPYRWSSLILEAGEPFGAEVERAIPVPVDGSGQWLLLLAQNGQDYQLWHETSEAWARVMSGSFGTRVTAAAGGRFVVGEGAGLFAQYESGRIGYWQVGAEGCLPVWQSPDPWPNAVSVRSGDLDGDGLDELLAINATGSVSIARWRNGLWESAWTLPPWGQVLDYDVAPSDGQPGLEVALVTSQRRLFLIGTSLGSFTTKARLTLPMVAAHVALVPQANGVVVLGDAGGNLDLFLSEGETWRAETHLAGGERLGLLTALGPERILVGTAAGALRVVHLVPLSRLAVFHDGQEVKNGGLYWDDGDFFFGLDFLQRTLGITGRWDEKKGILTLTRGKFSVVMEANKTEVKVDGRPWPLGRPLAVVGKTAYVPADLLRAVFLVNVTYDAGSDWLILTSSST